MNHENRRCIVVCADDFGASPSVDAAILQLARSGAISAVSTFSRGGSSERATAALRDLPLSVSVGLHVDMTEPREVTRPITSWLARSLLPRASQPAWLRAELQRQCAQFEERLGRVPDFIDGHEHVHQLRGIRETLLSVIRERYGNRMAMRTTSPRAWRGAKAALIATLGGRALARELGARGWVTNRDFAGVYDFSTRVPYAERVARWLGDLIDLGLLMCHPRMPDETQPASGREAEYAFLSSPAWPEMQRRFDIVLVPFVGRSTP